MEKIRDNIIKDKIHHVNEYDSIIFKVMYKCFKILIKDI